MKWFESSGSSRPIKVAGSRRLTASELAGLVRGKHVNILRAARLFSAKFRETCSRFLANSSPQQGAGTVGVRGGAGDLDSRVLSLAGLEVI